MKNPTTAKFIKDKRQSLGLTQKELGKIINRKRDCVASYEIGRLRVPGDIVLFLQEYKLKK